MGYDEAAYGILQNEIADHITPFIAETLLTYIPQQKMLSVLESAEKEAYIQEI